MFNPVINFRPNKKPMLDQLENSLLKEFDSDGTGITLAGINAVDARYDSDYENLKVDLGLPDNIEFAFIFSDDEAGWPGDIVAEKNLPETIDIFTREVFVLYYDEEREDYGGFLTIKVW